MGAHTSRTQDTRRPKSTTLSRGRMRSVAAVVMTKALWRTAGVTSCQTASRAPGVLIVRRCPEPDAATVRGLGDQAIRQRHRPAGLGLQPEKTHVESVGELVGPCALVARAPLTPASSCSRRAISASSVILGFLGFGTVSMNPCLQHNLPGWYLDPGPAEVTNEPDPAPG